MLEAHVAELLATHLSRFIKNVSADQLQISLWSGNVVLNDVQLCSDVLERITALLHCEHSGNLTDDAGVSLPTSPDTSSGASEFHEGGSSNPTLSMRMLLAPFTVVKGIIRKLAITVPWSSLESEPVRVHVVGVELVLGPLRARPFNAREEKERGQAIKQQQLKRYEKERHRLSREVATETANPTSSMKTVSTKAVHVGRGAELSLAGTNVASGASWFSWLWNFDRMSHIALRNVRVTLEDISMRYELDYEGLHHACASALCVFVRQVQLTTTDEKFKDAFNKDLLAPLCKRILLSGVVVSTHAIRQSLCSATSSTGEGGDAPTRTAAGELAGCSAAYDRYASRWAHSTAILRVQTLQLQAKLVPPRCASRSSIVEEAPILSASSIELTVATVSGVEVDWCFGLVQVFEFMWRSYHQSLPCARYRIHLHLLRPTRGHATRAPLFDQASEPSYTSLPQDTVNASRPSAQQRWRFALRCIRDDVRLQWHTFGLQDRRQCKVVEAMVQFGQLRRDYSAYWKRRQGIAWAPALSAVEDKKLESMERQLSLWQVIFLRCLSNAQLILEREGYARQKAYVEEVRHRTQRGLLGSSREAGEVEGDRPTSFLWGWLFGRSTPVVEDDDAALCRTPLLPITSRYDMCAASVSMHGLPSLGDLVALEWEFGRRYTSQHHAPLLQLGAPQHCLSELATENKLYFTLHVLLSKLIVRLDPTYWPLITDSSVPATPSATPLQRVEQRLVVQLRAVELFYTTISDDRSDKASLSFFIGSASIVFEGVLRSVLLESKEQFKEDCLVVKRNAQRTHISVWVAPQLVICQPMHEWAWWYAEVSAFAQWFRAVQQASYVSRNTKGFPFAVSPFTKGSGSDVHDAACAAARTTASASGTSSPRCNPSHTTAATTPSRAPLAPLMVSVILQSLDVCVPLFAHDIESSDLEILVHKPSAFSSGRLAGPQQASTPYHSSSTGGKWHWGSSTDIASAGGHVSEGKPHGEANVPGDGDAPLAPLLRTKDGIQRFSVESCTDKEEYADSLYSSHNGSVDSFASVKPERCFLKGEACLVLSVSTTRLWTAAPPTKRYNGVENEYYLCIGDHSKAVRLFCQNGYHAHMLTSSWQRELLSFVAGEVLLNPKELTVLFNKGIDGVADPAVFAYVSDALLKPKVFAAIDASGQVVRALTAELQQAERRRSGTRGAAVPWRLTTSTCVEVRADCDSALVLREVPLDCARHIISALSATFSMVPNLLTMMDHATPSDEAATGVLGGRIVTVGMGVARLFIRSEANVDLAELVLVAPEHASSATAPCCGAFAVLGAAEPHAMELICNFTGSPLDAVEENGYHQLLFCPPSGKVRHGFLLSIPDITMTTTAGRKLLTVENLTAMQTCATSGRPEMSLTIQTVSVFCDAVLVELLEVFVSTVRTMRPMTLPPELAANDLTAASHSTFAHSERPPSFLLGVHPISVRVQTARFQIPLSRGVVVDAPYVEVTASIGDLLCTLDHLTGDTARDGQHVHIEFSVSEAMQLADYIGGDPEVRSLISTSPRSTCSGEDTAHALGCVVDLMLPVSCVAGANTATSTRTEVQPSMTCRVAMMGGALHVYCPFLYLYAAAAQTDERIVRLGELARSPLLRRGYTYGPCFADCTRGASVVGGAHVSPAAAAPLSLTVEVTISDLDVLLATDAAVPIDMTKPETFSLAHVKQIVCGLQRTLSESPGASTTLKTRTHTFVDITGMQLLGLLSASSHDVCLPNVKMRAEMGLLLVPKDDLTGYAYQSAAPADWALLVEVHPAAVPHARHGALMHAAASSTANPFSNVTIHLTAQQCYNLASFFVCNVVQPPIPTAKHTPIGGGGGLQHELGVQPAVSLHMGGHSSLSSSDHDAKASSHERTTPSSAVTVLLTIPEVFIVIDAGDCVRPDKSVYQPTVRSSAEEGECKSSAPAAPPPPLPSTGRVSYEVALRRGAQLYSAAGRQWSRLPVKNGQLGGLELVAREEVLDSPAGHANATGRVRRHLLLTIEAVSVALLEQLSGRASSKADDDAAAIKVAAAVQHLHLSVPHIKWWLQLYSMFAGCSKQSSAGRTPHPSGSVGYAPSFGDADQNEGVSGQGSNFSGRHCGVCRGGYVGGDKTAWSKCQGHQASRQRTSRQLYGAVEVLHAQASFFSVGHTNGDQRPWCRLTVPKARLRASPLRVLQDGGRAHMKEAECIRREFIFEVPQCPELLLLHVSGESVGTAGPQPQGLPGFSYVSVLRLQHVEAPSTASAVLHERSSFWRQAAAEKGRTASPSPPLLSGHSSEACLSVRLLCAPNPGSLGSFRYGRRYHVTDLTLHRTPALQVRLQHVRLEIPAVPLFSLVREVVRQLQEAQSIEELKPLTPASPCHGREAESLARTYMGIEAELTDAEVRLSAESSALGELTGNCCPASGPVCWSVSVSSARLTTSQQLRSVLTSTRKAATLIGDEPSGGWGVQIWHMIPEVLFQDVVLSTSSDTQVRWAPPDVRTTVSLPLMHRIICVRAKRTTGADDELDLLSSFDDSPLQLRHPSTTNLFQVEPAVATAFNQLNYHVLASLVVHVGAESDDAAGKTPGFQAPVEVSLPTIFTLASAAAQLIALWRRTEESCKSSGGAAVDACAGGIHVGWWCRNARRVSGPSIWWECQLSFSGRRVEVMLGPESAPFGDKATVAQNRDCVMCVSVDGVITLQLDKEVSEDAGEQATVFDIAEDDASEEDIGKWYGCVDDESAEVAAGHTLFRLRTGPLHVYDGANNLLLHVSEVAQSGMTDALVADYAPAEARMGIIVGQVVVHASSITAASLVCWWRAYQALVQTWTRSPAFTALSAVCPHGKSESELTMAIEDGRPSSWLQDIHVEVHHAELLLAPAAHVCARRTDIMFSPVEAEGVSGRAAVLKLRCEEVCVCSMLPQPGAAYNRNPMVLARTASPTLVVTSAPQQRLLLQYRTPLVSIMNSNGHSWAMCVHQVVKVATATLTAVAAGADIAPFQELTSNPSAGGPVPFWVTWIPCAEIEVHKAEFLCIAPNSKRTCFAVPAVCFVAREAALRYVNSARLIDSSSVGTMAGIRLELSAVISATYNSGSSADVKAHPLLDDVMTTFVLSASSQSAADPVEVTLSVDAATQQNAVCLHVPTGSALECTVAALWLLARGQVSRGYAQTKAKKKSPASGDEVRSGMGTIWHVRADVPRVLLHCTVEEGVFPFSAQTLLPLCLIHVDDIHVEWRTRRGDEKGSDRRPYVKVWVTSIVGETAITDATSALNELVMGMPSTFLTLRPLEEATSNCSPRTAFATGGATSSSCSSSSSAGFSVVQRSLSLSSGGEEHNRAAQYFDADDATALVVRLHMLHAHPSMVLLKVLMERVLHPCVTGISIARADASAAHRLDGLTHTVVRVDSAAAVLPASETLNHHDGRVQVVEVVTDWHLYNDVRLGGEGGFQLYFRSTAGRSVITVRGGAAGDNKAQGSMVTIFLSLLVCANGEVCSAIRVDPDLTVRFENVRVVVGEETDAVSQDAGVFEAFVELGERSLCLLPPPFVSVSAPLATVATEAQTEEAAASDTANNAPVPNAPTARPWAVSVMFSVDAAVDFDVSLTAGARRLAAMGVAKARYRFEEKRYPGRTLRREHESECTISLHTCVSESGPLTVTPVAATAQLSFTAEENRLRVVLNCGSTRWRLPLGHAQVLIELGRVAYQALYQIPLPSPTQGPWHPRAPGGTLVHGPTRHATPLDVTATVPLWAFTLTSDTGRALAELLVEQVCVQCAADIDAADVALTAEATVSLRDCIEFHGESGGHQDATALHTTEDPSVRSATAAMAARVLFRAQPHVSLSFTRFSPGSRSLSVSVDVDDVIATLPLTTAARLLRESTREMDDGRRVFWNDSGVEMEVAESIPHTAEFCSSPTRWHLAAAPEPLVRTDIPVSCAVLMLTPVSTPGYAVSSTLGRKDGEGSGGVAVHVEALDDGAVCRVSLPGYTSALGALDLVVRKSVRDGLETVHLTSSVVLANVFYAGTSDGSGVASVAAGIVSVTTESARLVVPPRSARYVPLPVLQECLTLELDGCAYAPVAKMLTWAMMADAMAALADELASSNGGSSDGSGSGGGVSRRSEATASLMLYGNMNAHERGSADNSNGHSKTLRAPALCDRVRALDPFTLTFPMLLSPASPTPGKLLCGESTGGSDNGVTFAEASGPESKVSALHIEKATGAGRVVQLTWRRRCSRQAVPLFTGRLSPSEYTVSVEPVWTLWNWSGCRLRLRLRISREEVVNSPVKAPHTTSSAPSPLLASSSSDVVATAEVENGACFQWTPSTLDVLQGTVFSFFQLLAPSLAGDSATLPSLSPLAQWWSFAAPLSLQEPPPSYIRLVQESGVTRGAVRIEQRGLSTIAVRCAALLRSALTRPVYLRDAEQPQPLLGTSAHGCVMPQQQVPLFFSEYVTTLAPHADRVGFVVSTSPVMGAGKSTASVQETDAYYLTTPTVTTLLVADEQADCTRFYTVAPMPNTRCERPAAHMQHHRKAENDTAEGCVPEQVLSCFCTPEPPAVVQLRSLCCIRNTHAHRTLLAMPFDSSAPSNEKRATRASSMVTLIPPGEEREVTEFCPHTKEPEIQFCYSTSGGQAPAHTWSPPVKLLSLARLTQPLVLKHTCASSDLQGVETDAPAEMSCFTMNPVPRRAGEKATLTVEHFRCLTVQSSMTSAYLCVTVGLQAAPPVKIVNRLNTTLQFSQCALTRDSDLASPLTQRGTISTAVCSRAARPCSYMVAAETMSYGCWEVPTLEAPGLRVTLHSNVRKGFTASHNVDLLRCATSPSSGARIGNTDAYVYVSLDHRLWQYTVTVAPSRQLESRMLSQPRRLTQLEVYVHSCTVYVAAITMPTEGPFARPSLIAHGARGRMRLRRGVRSGESTSRDTVPLHATDEDVLTFLKEQEIDVVLVRVLGFYGATTITERHLMGSASLALLEVVDCTRVEAAYPVLLRVGPRVGSGSVATTEGSAAAEPSAEAERGGVGTALLMPPTSVPHFKDPSWLAVELQLTRPEQAAAADEIVLLPVPHLRVTVPLIVVSADDDFLFTLRTTAERLRKDWAAAAPIELGGCGSEWRGSPLSKGSAVVADSTSHSSHCAYSIFVRTLRISPVVAEVTYTRCGRRRYNPFQGLAQIPGHLIPSFEGLPLSLKEVRLREVELRWSPSLVHVAKSFLWSLYRTEVLLQSCKVVGSLDVLGNPRALLGSWSRGVWNLITNSSGQSRWTDTREFLRTTTSSTLHSVGVLARSIGNLADTSPSTVAIRVPSGSSPNSASGCAVLGTSQRRGVLGEVLHEVGGSLSDAVTKPIRGARESGVSGFFSGVAAGVVGLAGRPLFGFFRGVSATSEFYARLLGGLGELTEHEARHLGLERNYVVVFTNTKGAPMSETTEGVEWQVSSPAAAPQMSDVLRASLRSGQGILTHVMYDKFFTDVSLWRRGEDANVRLAVNRVGIYNAALHTPYVALCTFLSPNEFRSALPCALTALLTDKLISVLAPNSNVDSAGGTVDVDKWSGMAHAQFAAGERQATRALLAWEFKRASHIKASLGVQALRAYVTDEVFVRVCSLAEMDSSLTTTEAQKKYSLVLARAMSAAGKHLLTP
ncbi:hypothetical protein LPMP_351470 [Leishmania panamensis]|uniref:Vacuolar protein sorting protein, putative n=1 Tax=Leishmania panamensis TaxID=5679 RepID=A0A088S217_LEIPA|nr:hypothetical protein LPMP_351470 [Leishmania panamensis]AIO02284.1 hypothetical protein LPMP_351470 [Leishmania panamensis]